MIFISRQRKHKALKPGDLVLFTTQNESKKSFFKDHFSWLEQRNSPLNGELCVILEIDYCDVSAPDVKLLYSNGTTVWTQSFFLKKISI